MDTYVTHAWHPLWKDIPSHVSYFVLVWVEMTRFALLKKRWRFSLICKINETVWQGSDSLHMPYLWHYFLSATNYSSWEIFFFKWEFDFCNFNWIRTCVSRMEEHRSNLFKQLEVSAVCRGLEQGENLLLKTENSNKKLHAFIVEGIFFFFAPSNIIHIKTVLIFSVCHSFP